MVDRLIPPPNGVTVRMYRIGHGDCFLLAFPRKGGGEPVYVLIDCGRKPGSQNYIHKKAIGKFAEHIGAATNNHLDLVVITHEHQDHINGFWKKINPYFKDIVVKKCWLAWTEDPDDPLAEEIRQRHNDQLLLLANARHQFRAFEAEDHPQLDILDSLLSLEYGGQAVNLNPDTFLAAVNASNSHNKQAMKLIKDKANMHDGIAYMRPGGSPEPLPGTDGYRVFVLGPPRDEAAILDEDPKESEGFPDSENDAHALSFAAAAWRAANARVAPFGRRYRISLEAARKQDFFTNHYGYDDLGKDTENDIVVENAHFRRIDTAWLSPAIAIALKHNKGVNNTSLVLAFELPQSKKALLFAADAQRGSWASWSEAVWLDDGNEVNARDILARTVLYKVGHHGSHNATLSGQEDSDYANLSWMGTDTNSSEFTAMITAVSKWAEEKNNPPWRHPLFAIKQALVEKARGRVFQTDTNELVKPDNVPNEEWDSFLARCTFDDLYFDYVILDDEDA